MPSLAVSDAATNKALIEELQGNRCRCGQAKKRGQTFCQACYFKLPPKLRGRLYRRVGQGYAEAYQEATAYLNGR